MQLPPPIPENVPVAVQNPFEGFYFDIAPKQQWIILETVESAFEYFVKDNRALDKDHKAKDRATKKYRKRYEKIEKYIKTKFEDKSSLLRPIQDYAEKLLAQWKTTVNRKDATVARLCGFQFAEKVLNEIKEKMSQNVSVGIELDDKALKHFIDGKPLGRPLHKNDNKHIPDYSGDDCICTYTLDPAYAPKDSDSSTISDSSEDSNGDDKQASRGDSNEVPEGTEHPMFKKPATDSDQNVHEADIHPMFKKPANVSDGKHEKQASPDSDVVPDGDFIHPKLIDNHACEEEKQGSPRPRRLKSIDEVELSNGTLFYSLICALVAFMALSILFRIFRSSARKSALRAHLEHCYYPEIKVMH